MELEEKAYLDLKMYLLAHEDDIYYGINDFSELAYLFRTVLARHPMEMIVDAPR